VVWVVKGAVRDGSVAVVVLVVVDCGSGATPRDWAAAVCVRKAKGAVSPCEISLEGFAGDVEERGSRFGAVAGWRRARNRAICASLRVFSATRAACSLSVSASLRRRAWRASGLSVESLGGIWRFCFLS
jgi:hypothetical protein